MLVSPTIRNLKVTKMLVDGGAGLNLISSAILRRLQVPDSELEETGTFQGINPGRSKPKGKITLPVTFGSELNFRTEKVTFDVADLPLPYNGILGRPALAKFMAASHYAYNMLKMPGPISVISVPGDKKDALICADQLYRDATAAAARGPLAAGASGGKKKSGKCSGAHSGKRASSECCAAVEDVPSSPAGKKTKSGKCSGAHSGKRASSECCAAVEDVPSSPADKKTKPGKCSGAHSGKRASSECCAAVEDVPSSPAGKKAKPGECSGAHSGKRASSERCAAVEDAPLSPAGKHKETTAAPPATKKVPAKEDGTGGTFTISATLDPK